MSLAEMVVQAAGKPIEIQVKNEGLGREYSGDNSRLLAEVPDFQFRDMQQSVTWLYRWYLDRKHTIDRAQLRLDG
jgi:GDP-L-fucose synthase